MSKNLGDLFRILQGGRNVDNILSTGAARLAINIAIEEGRNSEDGVIFKELTITGREMRYIFESRHNTATKITFEQCKFVGNVFEESSKIKALNINELYLNNNHSDNFSQLDTTMLIIKVCYSYGIPLQKINVNNSAVNVENIEFLEQVVKFPTLQELNIDGFRLNSDVLSALISSVDEVEVLSSTKDDVSEGAQQITTENPDQIDEVLAEHISLLDTKMSVLSSNESKIQLIKDTIFRAALNADFDLVKLIYSSPEKYPFELATVQAGETLVDIISDLGAADLVNFLVDGIKDHLQPTSISSTTEGFTCDNEEVELTGATLQSVNFDHHDDNA